MDSVECYSGSEYAERPLAVTWQGLHMEIVEILERWRGPETKGFRVRTTAGTVFELTYLEISEQWHVQPL